MATAAKTLLCLALIALVFITATLCDDHDKHRSGHHDDSDDDDDGPRLPKKGCREEEGDSKHLSVGKIAILATGIAIVICFIVGCVVKKKCFNRHRVQSANQTVIEKVPHTLGFYPEKKGPLPPDFVIPPKSVPEGVPTAPPAYLGIDLSKMDMPPPYEKIPSTIVLNDTEPVKGYSMFP